MLKKANDKFRWNMKLSITIIPVVAIMIAIFFSLTSNYIINLSEKNQKLHSEMCANKLNSWTERIEGELYVYKKTIDDNYSQKKDLKNFVEQTYNVHKDYPVGLYVGDDSGYYVDASGWKPGKGWVLKERPWYVAAANSSELVFSEPYVDAMLNKLCISISVRLNYTKYVRVMATDVYMDYAKQLIKEVTEGSDVEGALFVTGENRIIIANSGDGVVGKALSKDNTSLSKKIDKMIVQKKVGQNEVKVDKELYYINIKKMDSTGWFLVTYIKKKTILNNFYLIQVIMGIVALVGSIVLIILTRIYARKMTRISQKSKTDKLTNALNREGFEEQVSAYLTESPEQGALLILDMDNFKLVNDNLGHPIGDRVLCEFAELLENFFNRKQDVVARIGGDEFAVFVGRDISYEDMENILKKFMGKMKETFAENYADFKLTSSIGGTFVKPELQYSILYQKADANLYEAKKNGKNRYKI